MIESAAHESCRGMTEVTIQGGSHMILRLARGRHAMAGLAVIHDAGVIENRTGESAGGMAHTAILFSRNMIGTLAFGKDTVVTRLAVIHDANVIKGRGQESGRYVAITAIRIGRNVIAGFAAGYVTVVA